MLHLDWLDPIHGVGYQFWSGVGQIAWLIAAGVAVWLWPTRCTQLGCRKRARAVSAAGAPFCERHLPEDAPV